MDWLKNDLDQATQNRKNTPWIIAIAHRFIFLIYSFIMIILFLCLSGPIFIFF